MNPTLKQSMKPDVVYKAITGTKCGTIQKGDLIRVSGDRLDNFGGLGWLNLGEWERLRCKVEIHRDLYIRRIEMNKKEIEEWEMILNEN